MAIEDADDDEGEGVLGAPGDDLVGLRVFGDSARVIGPVISILVLVSALNVYQLDDRLEGVKVGRVSRVEG